MVTSHAQRRSAPARPVKKTTRDASTGMFTPQDGVKDMKAHGLKVRKTKASARAFLIKAGILNKAGELIEELQD